MTKNTDQSMNDVPLGAIGKVLGLRVEPPKMQDGEEVRWWSRANMVQQRVRSVGGKLYLTDRRLVFERSRIESFLAGKEWSANLAELVVASEEGRRRIKVEQGDGRVEAFIVRSPRESAEVVNRAIRAAPSTSNNSS